MNVEKIVGYQVLDSRGRPTVAAVLLLSDGTSHTARVPSGASVGKHEARELRDQGTPFAEKNYRGTSVFAACNNINNLIAPHVHGKYPDLLKTDYFLQTLDSTEDFRNIGANATLAVSLAIAKAQAHAEKISLARLFQPEGKLKMPMPMVNILSGGAHAKKTMDVQDVLVIAHGTHSFSEALAWISAIREVAIVNGAKLGAPTHLVADEGGLAIPFKRVEEACDFVVSCIESVGLQPGRDVSLAMDVASTQLYHEGSYLLPNAGAKYDAQSFRLFISDLVKNLPLVSIEDPFAEDDWNSWSEFMEDAPKQLQVVGDDLYTTNLKRLEKGIAESASNAILVKPNQNGLVTKTLEVLKAAQAKNFNTIVSARSGETEDSWLADLAVGWGAGQIKVGSTHGSERAAKWNRLLELEATENWEFVSPF